jgi:His-Xaa-Ser system radical SAM maturase HxsB
MRQFYTIETYQSGKAGYSLLPFRFLRLDQERELLVSDVGEYAIVPRGTAVDLVNHRLDPKSSLFKTLKAKQLLYDNNSALLLDVLATKYRTKKSFLNGFAKLHIFVVTLRCDHSCHYCQVSRQTTDKTLYDMSPKMVDAGLKLMMRFPARDLTLEFQGGEPLLAFETIKYAVARAKALAAQHAKNLNIVICTNLAYADRDVLSYCRDENIKISTSLDGPAFLHNANRPRPENNSYELTIEGIQKAREIVGTQNVAAVMTTTRRSLDYPTEIVDEYVRQDFRSIFLRPISPYGFAVKSRHKTGYEMTRFLAFYKTALGHILDLNRNGINMQEVYAKIILTKILTPYPTGYVDLQSPTGSGTGVIVYNYNGAVYASDESRMLAEMNDETFQLGNVLNDDYDAILSGPAMQRLLSASCNESLPGCVDCALQPFCGADPVFHHATQGDIFGHRPTSAFCFKNMEIITHLFRLLAGNDRALLRTFFTWIRDQSHAEMIAEVPTCA